MKIVASLVLVTCSCSTLSSKESPNERFAQRRNGPGLPVATEPMKVRSEPKKTEATCADLLAEVTRVTGARFVVEKELRSGLSSTPLGLATELDVPVESVWTVAEAILVSRGYRLEILSRDPLLIDVIGPYNRGSRERPMNRGVYVPHEALAAWADHPAFLVQTAVHLDALNVRDLSNSMRQMFTDPQSQQILPIGSSQTLMLIGSAPSVFDLVMALREFNEAERDRCERLGLEPEIGTLPKPKLP